jgi:hypothetical protein
MTLRVPIALAAVAFIAISVQSRRAWAPPLCSYGSKIGGDVLTLRARLATVDGVQVTLPAGLYSLRSGCSVNGLDGVLADPDAADGRQTVAWAPVQP